MRLTSMLVFALLMTKGAWAQTVTYSPTIPLSARMDEGLQWSYANQAKVASGGSGYTVGDIVTPTGMTCTDVMSFVVTSVNGGGAASGIRPAPAGTCSAFPATFASAPVTGGTGTGLTVEFPAANLSAYIREIVRAAALSYAAQQIEMQRAVVGERLSSASRAETRQAAKVLGVVLP